MPHIGVLAQYVKDLSFENPNAPRSMAPSRAAADHQHPGQCRRRAGQSGPGGHRLRGDASPGRQSRIPGHDAVRLRTDICRRFPHPECAGREPAACRSDRMSAAVVSVCPRDRRYFGAQRWLSRRCCSIRSISSALYRQRLAAAQPRRHRNRSIRADVVAPDRALAKASDERPMRRALFVRNRDGKRHQALAYDDRLTGKARSGKAAWERTSCA